MKKIKITGAFSKKVKKRSSGLFEIVATGTNKEMEASDGYHTFGELYNHRITIYIALCRSVSSRVWRSRCHSDGELCFGTGSQYVLGIDKEKGKQITYHVPIERWDETNFAEVLDKAPEWDGHNSNDVIERLKAL